MTDKSTGIVPIVIKPGEGDKIYVSERMYHVWKSAGDPTKGTPDVWVAVVPPGEGPPLHQHSGFDETFLVLNGEFLIRANKETVKVGRGAWIYVPRGTSHAFHNIGPHTGELFIQTLPGGQMRAFFEDLNSVVVADPTDQEGIDRVNQRHGVVVVGPPIRPQTL